MGSFLAKSLCSPFPFGCNEVSIRDLLGVGITGFATDESKKIKRILETELRNDGWTECPTLHCTYCLFNRRNERFGIPRRQNQRAAFLQRQDDQIVLACDKQT